VARSQQLPSERLAADLRRRIAAGEWASGEQIPSVTALADSYSVSRATVAKALAVLADEGLIVRRHGWGTFVAEGS
jgi:GntR family transcriptional regulator